MTTILPIILFAGQLAAQTTTVPGTYPPVPTKYWVPVRQPTAASVQPTGRRMTVDGNTKKIEGGQGDDQADYEPLTESGIVRWAGGTKALHIVKKGETLWDLAKKYFGDHWVWPRLWSWNPHITNPHWLFPGTRVWLTNSGRVQKAEQLKPGFSGISVDTNVVKQRRKAFIQEKDLKKSSVVVGSVEEKTLLSVGDYVYIRQPKEKDRRLVVGERYMVYRPTDKILYKPEKKPKKGEKTDKKKKKKKPEKIGRVVKILGEVVIRELRPKNILPAQIVSSLDTIRRDDKVGTPLTTYNLVRPRQAPPKKHVIGKISHSIDSREMLSPGQIVLIDLGSKKGLSRGAVLKIVVRGDGLVAYLHPLDPAKKNDQSLPYESKGSLVVFHASEYYSLAMILKAEKPVNVGDAVVYGDYPDREKSDDSSEKRAGTVKYVEIK